MKGLGVRSGERVLIRGGTTSVGLMAAGLCKEMGCFVVATSRRRGRETEELLRGCGVDEVVVDDGRVSERLGEKVDKCLELVGTVTLRDSLKCVKRGGVCCMSGIVVSRMEVYRGGCANTVAGRRMDDEGLHSYGRHTLSRASDAVRRWPRRVQRDAAGGDGTICDKWHTESANRQSVQVGADRRST